MLSMLNLVGTSFAVDIISSICFDVAFTILLIFPLWQQKRQNKLLIFVLKIFPKRNQIQTLKFHVDVKTHLMLSVSTNTWLKFNEEIAIKEYPWSYGSMIHILFKTEMMMNKKKWRKIASYRSWAVKWSFITFAGP